MKKITLLLFIIAMNLNSNLFADTIKKIKRISEGEHNAKIKIITYESLTCSHCADFHKNIYPDTLKNYEEFTDQSLSFKIKNYLPSVVTSI